ncbi:hypothetical protein [Streptomyces sp. NPDC059611]|uniref:hypothetical protein n=1 Tax=Streptomyces sp. NPDC059611 TaxID=3346884 RepID=UPI0036BAC8D2
MKRNKPLMKLRKMGTQNRRRKPYRYQGRSTVYWALAVPQAFTGARGTVLDMTGATPAGADEARPDSPRYGGVMRWRIDRDGRTQFVYGVRVSERGQHQSQSAYEKRILKKMRLTLPVSEDAFHVFVAARPDCVRGKRCPLAWHWYTAIEADLSRHRADQCPMGVLNDGPPWRLVGGTVPDGRLIC